MEKMENKEQVTTKLVKNVLNNVSPMMFRGTCYGGIQYLDELKSKLKIGDIFIVEPYGVMISCTDKVMKNNGKLVNKYECLCTDIDYAVRGTLKFRCCGMDTDSLKMRGYDLARFFEDCVKNTSMCNGCEKKDDCYLKWRLKKASKQ